MAEKGYIEDSLASIDTLTSGFIVSIYDALSAALVAPTIYIGSLLFIILGFLAWYGKIDLKNMAVQIIRFCFIFWFLINSTVTLEIIQNIFIEFPDLIGSKIVEIATKNIETSIIIKSGAQALGIIMDQGFGLASLVYEKSSLGSIGSIYAFIILILTLLLVGFAFGSLILIKILGALLIGVFPVFLILLILTATKGLFEGWLRAASVVAVYPILLFIMLAFAYVVTTEGVEEAKRLIDLKVDKCYSVGKASPREVCDKVTSFSTSDINPFLLVYAGIFLVMINLLGFARQIASGAGVTSMGALMNASRSAANKASTGARSAVNAGTSIVRSMRK